MIAVQCPGADDVEVMTHLAGADESVAFKKKGYVIYESAHNLQIYQVFVLFLYDKVENMTDFDDSLMAKMAQDGIHAGFPSPATDYMTQAIDLNRELVKHPAATFYGRVVGDSMIDAGVEEGDILVIDKSLEAQDGDMAVCFIDGEFTLKYLRFHNGGLTLVPANEKYPSIEIEGDTDFIMWGVVTHVIKKIR